MLLAPGSVADKAADNDFLGENTFAVPTFFGGAEEGGHGAVIMQLDAGVSVIAWEARQFDFGGSQNSAPFALKGLTFPQADPDDDGQYWELGYNIHPSTNGTLGPEDTCSAFLSWEVNFREPGGELWCEFHYDYVDSANHQYRPFQINAYRDDTDMFNRIAWIFHGANYSFNSGVSNSNIADERIFYQLLDYSALAGTGGSVSGSERQMYCYNDSVNNFSIFAATNNRPLIKQLNAAADGYDFYPYFDGSNGYRLQIVQDGFSRPNRTHYQARTSTTNATPTTIISIPIPASTTVKIMVSVVSRRSSGSGTAEDGGTHVRTWTVKNVAGTATIIGTVQLMVTQESVAGYDVTGAGSGANWLVQVTGVLTTNIDWNANVEVETCSP